MAESYLKRIERLERNTRIDGFYMLFLLGLVIALCGGMGNTMAIAHNGGKMPVLSAYDFNLSSHYSFTNRFEVNSYALTDRFNIGNYYFSPGDILILFGLIIAGYGIGRFSSLTLINIKLQMKKIK